MRRKGARVGHPHLGTLLWPAVLLSVVPARDHDQRALRRFLGVGRGRVVRRRVLYAPRSRERGRSPRDLAFRSHELAPLSFGLCGLLKPDGQYTHLFLRQWSASPVVVLPSHNLRHNCIEEQVFESVQKAALIWCIRFSWWPASLGPRPTDDESVSQVHACWAVVSSPLVVGSTRRAMSKVTQAGVFWR